MAGIVQDPVGLAARKQALVKIGTDIAASISRQLSVKYGDFVPVTLNRIAIEDLCDRYWASKEFFKTHNNFRKGHLVNAPKKAALTIYEIWADPKNLFDIGAEEDYLPNIPVQKRSEPRIMVGA